MTLLATLRAADCPHFEDHTPCPDGYIAWHDWARKMNRTHLATKCKGCGLFKIWVPRRTRNEETER